MKDIALNPDTIMLDIYKKTRLAYKKGKGPFYAEIYDGEGNLIASSSNSVTEDECSLCHAEINAIKLAHNKYKTYDLSPFDLSIFINAEPCVMCMGAIMWSGIRHVYFGVKSSDVEDITGFDEGYKPNWVEEFKRRGIDVTSGICEDEGKKVLFDYVHSGGKIYKPER